MYKATCSVCGKECEVPFRPTSGKPVYCSEHFEQMGGRRGDSERSERPDYRAPNLDQNKVQFDALNFKLEVLSAKIEKVLKLLEPAAIAPVVPAPIVEVQKETKVIKPKKVTKKAK